MNPLQMLGSVIKSGGNPLKIVMQMMRSNMNINPMMPNVMQMAERQDAQGLEQYARNLAKENGIDVEQGLQMIRQNMGF